MVSSYTPQNFSTVFLNRIYRFLKRYQHFKISWLQLEFEPEILHRYQEISKRSYYVCEFFVKIALRIENAYIVASLYIHCHCASMFRERLYDQNRERLTDVILQQDSTECMTRSQQFLMVFNAMISSYTGQNFSIVFFNRIYAKFIVDMDIYKQSLNAKISDLL